MPQYIIQKHFGNTTVNPNSTDRYEWIAAFGLKSGRSYFDAPNNDEAIRKFKAEIEKSKKPKFRLMSFGGAGYGTSLNLVAKQNC